MHYLTLGFMCRNVECEGERGDGKWWSGKVDRNDMDR